MDPDPALSCRDQRDPRLETAASFKEASSDELTFAGGVEQSGLETGQRRVRQGVLDGHLDSEGRVWVDVGQGQQVGGAHEEVPVERMDGQT